MRTFLLTLALFAIAAISRAEPFEIKDGDRVLFLGDTLLEREGTYGYLETRMVEQFPDRKFTVRNLAFSGDTPLGWSRASFDPAAKGFERLKEQLALVKPTVVFLGYGMAASLQEMTDRSQDWTLNPDPARYGTEPMSAARFKKELAQCMDAIEEISRTATVADPAIEKGSARASRAVPGAPPGTSAVEGRPNSSKTPNERTRTPDASGGAPDAAREARALPIRFVLLSPIRHEDLRATRPGTPDPAEHNKLLEQYTKVIEELAKERGARFVSLADITKIIGTIVRPDSSDITSPPPERDAVHTTDNGIHLNEYGYAQMAQIVVTALWFGNHVTTAVDITPSHKTWDEVLKDAKEADRLRAAIIRKNELFFHRWRPANETYLFGFRKREQGQNAVEIPKFDPLIEAAEAEIERLKNDPSAKPAALAAAPQPAPFVSQPHPTFTLADGLEISLWAENPLLAKPTEVNWDAQGRLWVASSAMYPQIAPGQTAFDKILVIEDTDRDGKAEKSTVFADGLLMPTGVAPVLTPEGKWACYVGQSTELLYFEDTDGDGKADKKRIVFSGFGTEDTHHIVHTLRWGPDGRLYFSQSIYIHTHMETPWGIVRLNSGGTFAYDPRTERVEVVQRGLWNTWGHAWDQWGQSFHTDGAGSSGISWAFPGATFAPFEGARRTMASISPGSYPKFAGLELIYSPHFPADWQGSAVTCDFRAHKVVHFKITDLGSNAETQRRGEEGNITASATAVTSGSPIPPSPSSSSPRLGVSALKSGYTTEQLPVLVQTSDATFRPIDVKLGPDGALYIADWSNPIINHGEVDFRDPRRDHEHGRIWRLSVKGGAAVKWNDLNKLSGKELIQQMESGSLWAVANARQMLAKRGGDSVPVGAKIRMQRMEEAGDALGDWRHDSWNLKEPAKSLVHLELFWIEEHLYRDMGGPTLLYDAVPEARAIAARYIERLHETTELERGLLGRGPQTFGPPPTQKQIEAGQAAMEAASKRMPHMKSALVTDPSPRVRIEAMRDLARIHWHNSPIGPDVALENASLILDAAVNVPKDDPHYEFAAWLSINDLAPQVAEWVERNSADTASAANAPNAGQHASGSARAPRAVPGASPGTPDTASRPNSQPAPTGSANTADASGGAPNAAGGAPALPDAAATRDAKITLALQSLPPETSAPLLSKILAVRPLPRDGSGPWIDLIGASGGPAELRLLLDALLAATTPDGDSMKPLADARHLFTVPDANRRAAAALVAAARRGVKPAGEMPPWQFTMYAPEGALPDVFRLAGLWKQEHTNAIIGRIAGNKSAPVLDAAFEALRTLGTPKAADFLTAFFDPAQAKKLESEFLNSALEMKDSGNRRRALVALAALRPNDAMKYLPVVLAEVGEPGHLQLWRDLFASQPFVQRFSQVTPKDLQPAAYASAVRAAREMGRKGDGLAAKLAPLAGESTLKVAPADYVDLAARAKKDGDPVAGEAMYRRTASACTTCHAIGGAGGKLGPDMTSIGASAPPDYIIESILNPAAKVKEGYHAFTFAMKDGSEMIGIPTRETAQEQFIRTLAGEQGLPKTNIVSKKIMEGGASLMPAGLTAAWGDRERLNLYAFLAELGRPGPFDASKNNVARAWQLTDSGKVDGALKADAGGSPSAMPAIFAYTLVDGRLTKDLLTEKLAMLAPKHDAVHLTARFQAATAGRAKLNLTGIRKAWLDGQPLAIASEPSPTVDLTAGAHTFTIEVDAKTPPDVIRAESPAVSFLGD